MLAKKCVTAIGKLVEGPVWCKKRNSLFFTDIIFGTIFEYIPKMEKIQSWKMGTYAGCVIPGSRPDQIFAAVDDCLKVLFLETGTTKVLCPFPMPKGVRFNDGKCGPGGQLWIGIMEIDRPGEDTQPKGGLYRVDPEGRTDCVESHLSIPNGMAWDRKKGIFYHVRTKEQAVYAYRYHEERHLIQHPEKALDLSMEEGVPDGMTMDRDGNLWIAMWGGHRVICVNPASGIKLGEVMIPDANVSCCTFGGEHLDRLYITTAWDEQSGGNVYVTDTGAAGIYPYEFCWKEEEAI